MKPIAINLNTLLFAIGAAGVAGPDLKYAADWLAASGIPHVVGICHVFGFVATACGGLALMLPWLRRTLSILGLATPPGAVAPWIPTNTAAVIPQAPMAVPSTSADVVTMDITPPRKPDKGMAFSWTMAILLGLALGLCANLAYAKLAHAQTVAPQAIGCFDKANTYCLVPATALGDQVNLKDGSVTNGVLLVGLVLQHEFGTIPLGLGLYGGLGASTKNQGSYQGCIGVSITSWGLLCGGVQRATFADGSTALQGMLTFAGQLTSGGTPSFVRAQSSKLAAVSTSAGPVTGYPVDLNSGKAAR